jgi:hypothetical protein
VFESFTVKVPVSVVAHAREILAKLKKDHLVEVEKLTNKIAMTKDPDAFEEEATRLEMRGKHLTLHNVFRIMLTYGDGTLHGRHTPGLIDALCEYGIMRGRPRE